MKKVFSLLLAVLMLVSALPVAYAADTNDHSQGTQVVFEAANSESYTITVPASLKPGQGGTVTLAGEWPDNKTISVTADKTVTLTNSIKAADTKTLNVSFLGISEAGSNTSKQTFTEPVSVEGISNALFGTWSGKFNYNVDSVEEEGIATYVNQLAIATDVDGSVYNGTGYKANTYLSSGTPTATDDGLYTTGFIPAKLQDEVYLYDIDMTVGNSYNRIHFYDANKNYIGGMSTISPNLLNSVYNSDNQLEKFTVKSFGGADLSNAAYFRLCADYIDENSVITVNETASISTSLIAQSTATFTNTVRSHQSDSSFTFAFLSDAHTGFYKDTESVSTTRAAKAVAQIDNLDLVVHGGDLVGGGPTETVSTTYEHVNEYSSIMQNYINEPALWLIGNHDDVPYQVTANRLTQAQTFELFGSKNAAAGATYNTNCNYGYLDFENDKIRVIYLDTHDRRSWESAYSETTESDYLDILNIGSEQLNWLANTALDFSTKANPSDWGIVVVSHAELDKLNGTYTEPTTGKTYNYNTINALTILEAYAKGKSGTITHNNESVSYDFRNVNDTASIYCAVYGHGHKYADRVVNGIQLICCPNISNGRERASDNGVTYHKTIEGTAFCTITVDTAANKIYADNYGAGYGRVFDYIPLEKEGPSYTNLLPLATGTDGSIFNGTGYKENTYISSGNEGTRSGVYCSGFIPAKINDTIYFENCTIKANDNTRIAFYDKDMNFLALTKTTNTNYTGFTWDDNSNLTSISLKNRCAGDGNNEKIAYVRFCCDYIGADSIVTVNEVIE